MKFDGKERKRKEKRDDRSTSERRTSERRIPESETRNDDETETKGREKKTKTT